MSKLFDRVKRAIEVLVGRKNPVRPIKSKTDMPNVPKTKDEIQEFNVSPQQYQVQHNTADVYLGVKPFDETGLPNGMSTAYSLPAADANAINDALCAQCRRYASDISAQEVL